MRSDGWSVTAAAYLRRRRRRHPPCVCGRRSPQFVRSPVGRILLGVIIGVILVIWLLVSCLGAMF